MFNPIQLTIRRGVQLLLNSIFNHKFVFILIGKLNKRFKIISSIFLCYPATEEYALAYCTRKNIKSASWSPAITGLIKQGNKYALIMSITNYEEEFRQKESIPKLKQLAGHIEYLRQILNAEQKSFAGVLPGILFRNRIISETIETEVTVEVIAKAAEQVRQLEKLPVNTPLIILGGLGYVGRKLVHQISRQEVYCVDLKTNSWPTQLEGQPTILINVAKKGVLLDYIPLLWPEIVILNEVYPEPDKFELKQLTSIGCKVYHIAGIKGKAYPSFPKSYRGSIPCCAGRKADNLQPIVTHLNCQ